MANVDPKYEALFTPWKIGNVEIKNRIVMCPMGGTSLFGWFELTGCGFDKEAAKLFLERANNNVGLIIPGIAPLRDTFWGKWLWQNPKICGRQYTADEVMRILMKDRAFYESSGGGVTFSGGECMLQIDFLTEMLKRCKENGIQTAVDTAGHAPFAHFEQILPYTDLFLYDVKCIDSKKHKQYTGVGNELILENLRKLLQADANLWIRIPVICDVNDTVEEMTAIKALLTSFDKPCRVELLPYHAMGEHKYEALGTEMKKFRAPDEEMLNRLKEMLL